MNTREQKIHEEATALWRELFGETPAASTEASALLDRLMESLPEKGYDRLRSPFLRPAAVSSPGQSTAF